MCWYHLQPGERGSPERERDLEQEREPVPYSQHLHTHHHTHLGMGYTLMPGQYDPYPGRQPPGELATITMNEAHNVVIWAPSFKQAQYLYMYRRIGIEIKYEQVETS